MRHALADARYPLGGNARLIAVVEFRNDLLFEKSIDCFGFYSVPHGIVAEFTAIADGPTKVRRVGLSPPPSVSERFNPPFTNTFIPLVPLASQGLRGVL